MYWLYRHWYSVIINGKAVSILEELQEISQAISFRSVSWHSSCLLWYFLLEWRTGNEISNWRAFQESLTLQKDDRKRNRMVDGAAVSKEELSACSGVYDFQELVADGSFWKRRPGLHRKRNWKNCCRKIRKSALLRMNSVTEWFRSNPSTGNGGKRRGASVRSWQQRLIR